MDNDSYSSGSGVSNGDTERTDVARFILTNVGALIAAGGNGLVELETELAGLSLGRREAKLVHAVEKLDDIKDRLTDVQSMMREEIGRLKIARAPKPSPVGVPPRIPPPPAVVFVPRGATFLTKALIALLYVLALGLIAYAALTMQSGCAPLPPTAPRPIDTRNPYDPTQPPGIPRVTKCMGGPTSPDCLWPFGKRRDGGIDR